ncbi:hypothetical protein OSTOST_24146 [Ostertagia ostertagi]
MSFSGKICPMHGSTRTRNRSQKEGAHVSKNARSEFRVLYLHLKQLSYATAPDRESSQEIKLRSRWNSCCRFLDGLEEITEERKDCMRQIPSQGRHLEEITSPGDKDKDKDKSYNPTTANTMDTVSHTGYMSKEPARSKYQAAKGKSKEYKYDPSAHSKSIGVTSNTQGGPKRRHTRAKPRFGQSP